MKKKTTWKDVLSKMEAGKLCTDNQQYKWFFSCWKAYNNPRKNISNREMWWKGCVERFEDILETEQKNK